MSILQAGLSTSEPLAAGSTLTVTPLGSANVTMSAANVTGGGVQQSASAVTSTLYVGPFAQDVNVSITAASGQVSYSASKPQEVGISGITAAQAAVIVSEPTGVALDGDSFFAIANDMKSISTAAQSAGVATVTLGAAHNTIPGTVYRMSGFVDPLWNGDFMVVSTPSTTSFTAAISSTASATGTSDPNQSGLWAINLNHTNDRNPLMWAGAPNGGYYTLVNTSVGSRVSAQNLATFRAAAYAGCKVIVLECNANDAKNGVAAATTLANMAQRITLAKATGLLPVVMMSAPYGTTYAAFAAAQALNAQNMRILARTAGVPLWDVYGALVDKTSATGLPQAGMLDIDDIHIAPLGWKTACPTLYSILGTLGVYPAPVELLSSLLDVTGTGTQQILTNPQMAGTAGSTPAGVGGASAVPDNWTASYGSMTTWFCTKVTGRFGANTATKMTIQGSSGATGTLDSTSIHTLLTPGKKVRASARLIVNSLARVRVIMAVYMATITGNSGGYFFLMNCYNAGNAQNVLPIGSYTLDLQSAGEWTVPPGFVATSAIFRMYILPTEAGSGTSDFTLDSPAVWVR